MTKKAQAAVESPTAIPAPPVEAIVPITQEDLNTWYKLVEALAKVKEQENELRKKIFKFYFPNPVEGTNTAPLSGGWVIKGQHKINRKPDEALLAAQKEDLKAAGIPVDMLFKYKPELAVPIYRTLTEDQLKMVNAVIVIRDDGTPQLEIVKPRRAS